MRTNHLQRWVTIRGSATAVTSITQDEEDWVELRDAADAVFWIDVYETTGTVFLNLETAPSRDESMFKPAVAPVTLSAATNPFVAKTVRGASTATVPLARWLRWRLTTTSTGTWDATFRVRVSTARAPFFMPTQLSGCLLWLRADMGITLNTSNGRVSNWADQSGAGDSASQGTASAQPAYFTNIVNNQPAIQGDGSNYVMTTSAFTLGTNASFFVATQPLAAPSGNNRLVEFSSISTIPYWLGANSNGTAWNFAVNGTGVSGGTVFLANTLVAGVYNASTATLYVNGSSVASSTITAPSQLTQPLFILSERAAPPPNDRFNGYVAEILVYNRALAASEILQVHRYLGGRYGIAVP